MLTDNLYKEVLINPASNGGFNELFIVSGYASATFLRRHLIDMIEQGLDFKLNLIIGMPSRKSDHKAFLKLHNEYENFIRGHYYSGPVPVHSKVYSWFLDNNPIMAFAGSANYSQFGFFANKQINQMSFDDSTQIRYFYEYLLNDSLYIPEFEPEVDIVEELPLHEGGVLPGEIEWIEENKSVRISFLQRDGSLPGRSGLNWGQRLAKSVNKKTGEVSYAPRQPDQAYLSIKKTARKEGFLPEKGYTFTMITDDGVVLDCVVAQDGRKGVQTTNDNSELGRYIRNRLGVPHGTFLTVEHLINYGRSDFTLVKMDSETFLFDFSV